MRCITTPLLVMIYAALAMAAPDASALRTIKAKYAATVRAFIKKDAKTLFSIETPDFVAKVPGGRTMDRKHVEADFTRQMNSLHDVKWTRQIVGYEVIGKQIVVDVNSDLTGTTADPQGKNHVLLLKAKAKDTWVQVGKDWKIKQTELLESNVTIDGKSPGQPHP